MPKKSSARPEPPKTARVVPEWAKKVKAYREGAKKSQVEVEKVLKAAANTMSLVETGRREFTPTQRNLFFDLIGQPEDTSIPTTVRGIVPLVPKTAAKPAKPTKAPEQVLAKASVAGPEIQLAPDLPSAAPAERVTAPASSKDDARGTMKPTAKPRASKPAGAVLPVAPAVQLPAAAAAPAPIPGLSPVKDAVLKDLSRILGNPGLSDNQAKRLHGLFTSLAVNALLGD